jgi:serine/threonine-protein kinase
VPKPPVVRAAPPSTACLACGQIRGAGDDYLCGGCDAAADAVPQVVPGYRFVRELGRGAMGVVHLAVRQAAGALSAVKTVVPAVLDDPRQVQRFAREAEILCQLDHPNIVSFHEVGEAGGRLYFAMEYVRGTDLRRIIEEKKQLDLRTAVRLVCQVLAGLGHAHAKGFVHRDVKPANVLLAETDGKRVVKLADFGLARMYQASALSGLTLGGDLGGTPAYMPPEQIRNYRGVSPAADQYSTAAMLYHLLTGKFAFDLPAQLPMALMMILDEDAVPIRRRKPDVPEGLAAVVHRALARDAADRFPNVDAFRAALAPFGR